MCLVPTTTTTTTRPGGLTVGGGSDNPPRTSSSPPSNSGSLPSVREELRSGGGSEGDVTSPPEKGLLKTLLEKLYSLSGGRLGKPSEALRLEREQRSNARKPAVEKLAKAIAAGFRSMPQSSRANRVQMELELDGPVKAAMKELAETQKLAGEHFEEDFDALKKEIVDAVANELKAGPKKGCGFSSLPGVVPPKSDIEKLLFGTASGNLFDLKFACKKRAIPLTKKDRSTSPFTDDVRTRQDNRAAFGTSGAMFVQESSKLRSKKSAFKTMDPAVEARARRFFKCVRDYVADCKMRARNGEQVDVGVLNELKGLLDKSFNPKYGGVGRFPEPTHDKNADKRFMGWAFVKFDPRADLRGNGEALQVLEDQLAYYEDNIDDYLERGAENPIVLDAFATQVHGTLGQIFNDILFNPKFTDGPGKKEASALFAMLKREGEGVLDPRLDLDKLSDLQGRMRTNPLMMEINTENITGQVAERVLDDLRDELGEDYDISREILQTALMRSEHTTIDTVSGRRGRFKDVTESFRDEFTGRSDPLNFVMNMPDGDLDAEAQRRACRLCLDPTDGEQLDRAITKDKVFGHGMRPLTMQRDRTLPPQLESIAENPATTAEQVRDCLAREIGQIRDELVTLREKRNDLHELVDHLKNGKEPPRRFDQKGLLSKLFGRWDIDWSNPRDLEMVKSRLGALEEELEVLDMEISELEHRQDKAKSLQQRFLLASMPEGVRKLYVDKEARKIDGELQRLRQRAAPLQNARALAFSRGGHSTMPELDVLESQISHWEQRRQALLENAEKAPKLAEKLAQRDFGSIRVEDQQGRVHQLRDLARESTVSSMIHDAHQRTLCSISGTTTDIGLALYAQYGPECMSEWTGALLEVADGTRKPEDLPDSFREAFSSLSLFMQGGQYHTPAEVLGGMLIVGATLEKPGEAANKELMEKRYRSLLSQLEKEPESFFITDPAGREHYRANIEDVSEGLLTTTPTTPPKDKPPEPLMPGLLPRETFAFEEDIERGRVGLRRGNLQSREQVSSTDEVSRLRQAKQKQLKALRDRDWTGELLVSPHPGRSKSTELALERARTPGERAAILSDKARTDLSILKDEIDVLKGLSSLPQTVFEVAHPEYFTGSHPLELTGHLEQIGKVTEALDNVATGLGLIKYAIGIKKAGDKARALSSQLEQVERALGSLKVLEREVQSAAANKEKRREQLRGIRERLEHAESRAKLSPDQAQLLQQEKGKLENEIARLNKKIETAGTDSESQRLLQPDKDRLEKAKLELAAVQRKLDNPLLAEAEHLTGEVQRLTREIERVKNLQPPPGRDTAGSFERGKEQQLADLDRDLQAANRRLGQIKDISTGIEGLRKTYEDALVSYASQEEAVAKLQEAYNKLAPKAEKLLEDIKDLRYKLSENSWKQYIRYPAGIASSAFSLASALAPAISVLKFLGKVCGLLGLISAIASTIRVIRSGIAIHGLKKQIAEQKEALAKLETDMRDKLRGELGRDPSKAEVLDAISKDLDASSLKSLLESSVKDLEERKTDEWRDLVGEFLSALSGLASFALAVLSLAAASTGFGLPLALVGLGLGLVGSGVLVGSALAKRNRAERRANTMADLQTGLNDLSRGKPLSEVAASNPQIAKLAKKHGNDPEQVMKACRAYLQAHYINVHAQTTYNSLAGELDALKVFVQEKNVGGIESHEGYLPPPSSGDPNAQREYLQKVREEYNKGREGDQFKKDFPTLSRLSEMPGVGPRGIAEIVWSGSSKEGMATLLHKLGVKAVKTEDFTADSFNATPRSERGRERGLESAISGIHCNFHESGMAGVAIGLRKHASVFASHVGDDPFALQLREFSGRPSSTGSQTRAFFKGMQAFAGLEENSDSSRQPARVMRQVLGKAGLSSRMVEINPKKEDSIFSRKELSLRAVAQDRLKRSDTPESQLPFYVGISQFDENGARLGVPIDPMGSIETASGQTKFSPDLIVCNRGDSQRRSRHVTYERVGAQWFLNEGGRRMAVDLSAEALERGKKSPNLALRAMCHQIHRDLHENAVLVGYSVSQRPFTGPEKQEANLLLGQLKSTPKMGELGKARGSEAGRLATPPFSDLRSQFSDHETLDELQRVWQEAKTVVTQHPTSSEADAARGRLLAIHDFLSKLPPPGSPPVKETEGLPLTSGPTTSRTTTPPPSGSGTRSVPTGTTRTESPPRREDPYVVNKGIIDRRIEELRTSSLPNAKEALLRLRAMTRHGYSSLDGRSLPEGTDKLIEHLMDPKFTSGGLSEIEGLRTQAIASPGVGLSNGSNNCFMNSALAAFRGLGVTSNVPNTPRLTSYLSGHVTTDGQARALREEVARTQPDLPDGIRTSVRSGSSAQQHDASEVLFALLERSNMPKLQLKVTDKATSKDLSRSNTESFVAMPLMPPTGSATATIGGMIGNFLAPERIEGRNFPEPTEGNPNREVPYDANRTKAFDNVPDKLAVHIKRFAYNPLTQRTERLGVSVTDLLDGFTLPGTGDESGRRYAIKGVVCHLPGVETSNALSGHYVYYEHIEGDRWKEINDGTSTEFNIRTDLDRRQRILDNCYLATYEKRT